MYTRVNLLQFTSLRSAHFLENDIKFEQDTHIINKHFSYGDERLIPESSVMEAEGRGGVVLALWLFCCCAMYNRFVSLYNTTQFQGGHEVGSLTQFNNMNNTSVLNNAVVWQETRKLWYMGLEMLRNGGLIRESWCCCIYTTNFSNVFSIG